MVMANKDIYGTPLPGHWSLLAAALVFVLMLVPAHAVVHAGEALVREVHVEGHSSVTTEEILYLLDIKEGMPLDEPNVTIGVKRLFRKGIFESISVERDEADEGRIVVRVKEKPTIEDVDFSGHRRLSTSFLRRWLPLKEGMVLVSGGIERARDDLEDAISRRGFPDTVVEITVSELDDPYMVKLDVEVMESEPRYVGVIEIIGRTDYPDHKLKGMMRLNEGDIFDEFKLERDMARMEGFLSKKGHLKPDVGPYTFVDAQLLLGVRPGVRLEVEVEGNSAVSDRSIIGVMPFKEAGEVTDALVAEAVARIREMYLRHSFSETGIVPVVMGERDDLLLRFYIHEGESSWIGKIKVNSEAVPPEKLLQIMKLKEHNPFVAHELKRDVGRITEFYLALGYRDVEVAEPVVVRDGNRVNIILDIVEGPKVTYSDVNVTTEGKVRGEELAEGIAITPGDPYNEVDIVDARRGLQGACRSLGFYFCDVDVEREFSPPDKVALTFRVNEGDIFFFGKTIIKGNTRTRRPVFTRQLQYREGDVLDPSLLLKTRQRLIRLGLFRSVEIEPLHEDASEVDLALNVDESAPGAVSFGFGYGEYELYRGFIDISYSNLFGMNRRGSIRTEQSTLWSRYIINFQEPYLLGHELLSTTTFLYEKRKEKNIDSGEISYRIEKVSVSTGVEKDFTDHVKGTLSYSYAITRTTDVQPDVVLTRDDSGTLAISSLTPGIIYDSRDNPFDPSRGFFSSLNVKYASKVLGSDSRFVKTAARVGVYYPVIRRVVFATSVRGGAARAFDETEDLPLVERVFLGGRNT
ncbi:MAG: BamA/TamA family outer membrane protein, partial [Thermodesulfovibrionales bacterium]|nr:BamA/TamA family outer membrane protein [Thermodesulfovibrionales bacterium]